MRTRMIMRLAGTALLAAVVLTGCGGADGESAKEQAAAAKTTAERQAAVVAPPQGRHGGADGKEGDARARLGGQALHRYGPLEPPALGAPVARPGAPGGVDLPEAEQLT